MTPIMEYKSQFFNLQVDFLSRESLAFLDQKHSKMQSADWKKERKECKQKHYVGKYSSSQLETGMYRIRLFNWERVKWKETCIVISFVEFIVFANCLYFPGFQNPVGAAFSGFCHGIRLDIVASFSRMIRPEPDSSKSKVFADHPGWWEVTKTKRKLVFKRHKKFLHSTDAEHLHLKSVIIFTFEVVNRPQEDIFFFEKKDLVQCIC